MQQPRIDNFLLTFHFSDSDLKAKDAGLEHIRFHELRHTFTTMALQNGMDVKTVSSMLGHFDAGFTLRTYTHATRQNRSRWQRRWLGFPPRLYKTGTETENRGQRKGTDTPNVRPALSVRFAVWTKV